MGFDHDLPVEKIWDGKNNQRQPRFTFFTFEVLLTETIFCRYPSTILMPSHEKAWKWLKTFLNDARRNKFAVNPINLNHLNFFSSTNGYNLRKEHEISRCESISCNEIEHFLEECIFEFFFKLGPNIFQCNVLEITQLFVYFTFLLFIGFRTLIYASEDHFRNWTYRFWQKFAGFE